MEGNEINMTVVRYKVKAFIGKLGLWVTKRERKMLPMFSHSMGFCGGEQCGNKRQQK
jgi:hypothetical protein